jgi:hypothetical protein
MIKAACSLNAPRLLPQLTLRLAAKACKNLAFLRSVGAQAQAEGAKAYKKIDK